MTNEENQAIWDEIADLRRQLDELRVRRERLTAHAQELEDLHDTLKREAARTERLAKEIREAL